MTDVSNKKKIEIIDLLLIFGIVLAPMTNLRIWKIGPGEVLCFLWVVLNIHSTKIKITRVCKFFLGFLLPMLIGTVICYIWYPRELRLVDWFTWIYFMLFSCSLYNTLKSNSVEYNEKVLYALSTSSALWYSFLFVYSIFISRRIAGVSLWYGRVRFTGGASNPHQLAVLLCTITFVFLRETVKRKRVLLNIILMLCTMRVMYATKSTTGILSIVMGLVAFLVVISVDSVNSAVQKRFIIVGGIFASLIILILGYQILYGLFMDFMDSDVNGASRLEIFSHIGETFVKSPLFGLGPGIHSYWGSIRIEYHNSYLEILAASGIVGTISLINFLNYLFKKTSIDHMFIPLFVSVFVYAAAGFVMRRIVFWGIIILILVILEALEAQKIDSEI